MIELLISTVKIATKTGPEYYRVMLGELIDSMQYFSFPSVLLLKLALEESE